jgi:hypothetical protein
MKAVIVYESLWGHTAAVARAIGEGMGKGAVVVSTTDATADVLRDADLVVAGAPVHMMRLPSPKSREKARERGARPGAKAADLRHAPMAEWLRKLSKARGGCAAFDTRIAAQKGGCSAAKIASRLKKAGYRPAARPERFYVERVEDAPGPNVRFADGELDRARAWGRALAEQASRAR